MEVEVGKIFISRRGLRKQSERMEVTVTMNVTVKTSGSR